jgi:hypothetical protein
MDLREAFVRSVLLPRPFPGYARLASFKITWGYTCANIIFVIEGGKTSDIMKIE